MTQRTPAQNQTVRNVFVIAPDKTIKLVLVYPMTTGRNFDEVVAAPVHPHRPAAGDDGPGRVTRGLPSRTRT